LDLASRAVGGRYASSHSGPSMTNDNLRKTSPACAFFKARVHALRGRAPASMARRSDWIRSSNGPASFEKVTVTQVFRCCGVPYGQKGISFVARTLSANDPQWVHQMRNLPATGRYRGLCKHLGQSSINRHLCLWHMTIPPNRHSRRAETSPWLAMSWETQTGHHAGRLRGHAAWGLASIPGSRSP